MLVRFTRSIASPAWSGRKGKVLDLPEGEARGLVAAGYAEAVEEAPASSPPSVAAPALDTNPSEDAPAEDAPTAATVESPERAVKPRANRYNRWP